MFPSRAGLRKSKVTMTLRKLLTLSCSPRCPTHSSREAKVKFVIRHLFSLCVVKGQFCLQNKYRENATIPTAYCFTVETKTLSITGAWQKKKTNILPLKSLLLDESTISIVRSDQSCNWSKMPDSKHFYFLYSKPQFYKFFLIFLYKFKYKMGIPFQKS